MMDVGAKVVEIIAAQALLDPSDIRLDDQLSDLGVDSMALVESIFAIEEAFDITIPFNANTPNSENFDMTSVRSIIEGIEKLVRDQAA